MFFLSSLPFSLSHCLQDWRDRSYLDHPLQHINLSSLISTLVISAKTLNVLLTRSTKLCICVCVCACMCWAIAGDMWMRSAELVIWADNIISCVCVCVPVCVQNMTREWEEKIFLYKVFDRKLSSPYLIRIYVLLFWHFGSLKIWKDMINKSLIIFDIFSDWM